MTCPAPDLEPEEEPPEVDDGAEEVEEVEVNLASSEDSSLWTEAIALASLALTLSNWVGCPLLAAREEEAEVAWDSILEIALEAEATIEAEPEAIEDDTLDEDEDRDERDEDTDDAEDEAEDAEADDEADATDEAEEAEELAEELLLPPPVVPNCCWQKAVRLSREGWISAWEQWSLRQFL